MPWWAPVAALCFCLIAGCAALLAVALTVAAGRAERAADSSPAATTPTTCGAAVETHTCGRLSGHPINDEGQHQCSCGFDWLREPLSGRERARHEVLVGSGAHAAPSEPIT